MQVYIYDFGGAAIINYHRLGGLDNGNLFLLAFWRLEVWGQGEWVGFSGVSVAYTLPSSPCVFT